MWKKMTSGVVCIAALACATSGRAEPTTKPADGGKMAAPSPSSPSRSAEQDANVAKAHERMRADRAKFKPEQLGEIEALYQPSNDRSRRGAPEIKAALEKLIANFGLSNRAGCAVLYLAQWADGDERIKLLTEAFEKHDGDYYGDGCQVGPYARFQLAQWYDREKEPEKAKMQRDVLREKYPTATDHGGVTLVSQLPQE